MHRISRALRQAPLVLGLAATLSACGSDTTTAPLSSAPLTPAVLAAMEAGLQDEYHAAAVYQSVLTRFGDVLPFRNIILAERQHAASIAALFTNRGLAVPAERPLATLPVFGSVSEACATGAVAEVANIDLYDDFLALDLPYDVRRVFEANRVASLDKHLPAFERCGPVVITVR
jgi:hypothetical protein